MGPGLYSGTAALKLDVVIIGAGLSGLPAAYVFSKAGHRVRVLERRKDLNYPASGLRLLPNLTKILIQWLGEKELHKLARRCTGTPWYEMESGQRVGYTAWKPLVMQEAGGEFVVMHYSDAIHTLYDLARSAGAKVDFGVEVTSISTEPSPSVTLSTGEVISADIIVGADGPTSIARDFVLGAKENPQPQGVSVFTGNVPLAELEKVPELAEWVDREEQWHIVVGTNRSMGCHILKGKDREEYTAHIYWPDHELDTHEDGTFANYEVVSNDCILRYPDIAPRLRQLLELMPTMTRTQWVKGPELDSWSDDSQRVILVGEAAHPWLPSGTNGTSMMVEDSVVLGTIFSHLRSLQQIPVFVNAYEEIRQPRVHLSLEKEIAAYRAVWLPPGPTREARNAILAQGLARENEDDESEAVLAKDLEDYGEIIAYDAREAAEEWWVRWGRFHSFPGAEDYDASEALKIETRRMSYYHEEVLVEGSAV